MIAPLIQKIKNIFKKKSKSQKSDSVELPDNIIDLESFLKYRLKFNPENKKYQKVLEYSEEDLK
jgi:hypothetical protein